MSRRYGDAVQVRTGPVPRPGQRDEGHHDEQQHGQEQRGQEQHAPEQFLWRGRLYVVRSVLSHWVEVGAWWRTAARTLEGRGGVLPTPAPAAAPADVGAGSLPGGIPRQPPAGLPSPAERQVWRVEASSGRSAGVGVYDLPCDGQGGGWRLARALD